MSSIVYEVDKVESDTLPFDGILHTEVKPLCVALRVRIVLKHEIVLTIAYSKCCEEVAGLEVRIKFQASVILGILVLLDWEHLCLRGRHEVLLKYANLSLIHI